MPDLNGYPVLVGLLAAASGMTELSADQISKLQQIADVLDVLSPKRIDSELDAVLLALTEMRENDA
tara:strand:- start:172 stop:369 length:198 start_codon:yes stop_codon:yes gene_type:complete